MLFVVAAPLNVAPAKAMIDPIAKGRATGKTSAWPCWNGLPKRVSDAR
jgi:hypothetical protein